MNFSKKKENNYFFSFSTLKIRHISLLIPELCPQKKGQKNILFSVYPDIKSRFLIPKKVKKKRLLDSPLVNRPEKPLFFK
jgi:hypothetical protein